MFQRIVLFAMLVGFLCNPLIAQAQDSSWTSFALQVEFPPAPAETKNRDKKHKRDRDFEPTPAPQPEPDVTPEPLPPEPDSEPEAIPQKKRVKPLPQPGSEKGERDKDRHDMRVIDRVVYRTSWLPSLYDFFLGAWLLALSVLAVQIARRAGLDLQSILVFWK